jgi:hypothetical protein
MIEIAAMVTRHDLTRMRALPGNLNGLYVRLASNADGRKAGGKSRRRIFQQTRFACQNILQAAIEPLRAWR